MLDQTRRREIIFVDPVQVNPGAEDVHHTKTDGLHMQRPHAFLFASQVVGLTLLKSRYESAHHVHGCAEATKTEKEGVVKLAEMLDVEVGFWSCEYAD